MNIHELRMQLLQIANGDVDQAKHMEKYIYSNSSDVACGVAEENMGSAIRNASLSGGALSEGCGVDTGEPPVETSIHWSTAGDVKTPKGIRVQRQESASTYKLPDELLKSVDNFLYSLERSLQKQ